MNKQFWATTCTLSGAIIGAGILGLPFVFAQSGFLAGVFWIFMLSIILIFINFSLAEVTLRTKQKHQLAGYANMYLGPLGGKIMFIAMGFGVYSALIAYLVGEAQSFQQLLPGNINPLLIGFLFWLVMTLLLQDGLKSLKKVETYGVIAIIIIILGLFITHLKDINPANLTTLPPGNFTLPIGVILFALLGFTAIPELRLEIKGQEKLFKKAILLGFFIPIILYIIFTATFVGVLGQNVTEVATLSFGPLVTILGIFTMLTSYFVLSFALRDSFLLDFKFSKKKSFIFTSLLPLILFIIIEKFQLLGFSTILGIAGVISTGLTGFLILLIAKKAKETNKRTKQPPINVPLNWPLIILLTLAFIAGIVLQFT